MKERVKIEVLKKIDLYIRGELTQDEIDELWKTFLKNPEYYDLFETEVHLRNLIRKGHSPRFGPAAGNPSEMSLVRTYKGWLYAAAAAVILALGLQLFSLQQYEAVPRLAVAEIDPSNLTGADILRSGDQPSGHIDVAINMALAKAYEGETEVAIEQFQEILSQSPGDRQKAQVEMNLGILFYNSGRYDVAKDYFLSFAGIENMPDYQKEKSWWFLGNTYLNLDQPREARNAIYEAYRYNGSYRSAAYNLLNKLDLHLGNVPHDEAPQKLGD